MIAVVMWMRGDIRLIVMKPAVGFILPSARVTPAPGAKKDADFRSVAFFAATTTA
jgi:hypothetical protein